MITRCDEDDDSAQTTHDGVDNFAHHDSARKEADEISVVVLPHAVRDEGAVVVEPHHALAARLAVLRAWSLGAGQTRNHSRRQRSSC